MRSAPFFCPDVANVATSPSGLEGLNMGLQEALAVPRSNEHANVAILGHDPGGYVAALTAARQISVVRGSARLNGADRPTAVLEAALGFRDATVHMHLS